MKKTTKMTVTQAVNKVFNRKKSGSKFTRSSLVSAVSKMAPNAVPETVMRVLRKECNGKYAFEKGVYVKN